MVGSTPTEIAAAIFEAFDRRDTDAIIALFSDDVVDDYVPLRPAVGKDDARSMIVEIFEAFPDFSLEVVRIVGGEQVASVQWIARGTFTGEKYQGLTANGKTVELRGCDMMEFEDGLLKRNTVYFDYAGFARQLGVLPEIDSFAHNLLLNSFNVVTAIRDGASNLIHK